MGPRVLLLGLVLALDAGPQTPQALGCPYCRADSAGLAASAPPVGDDDDIPIQLSGGIDFASAFYFRGYLQADHGLIAQPYLNVFTARSLGEDVVVRPYVSFFNSTHFASNHRMSDMTDVMLGAVVNRGGLIVDTRYAYYTMNPLMRSNVHELGGKASFDVLSLRPEPSKPLGLRPFVGLYGELSDENGTEDLFLNLGLEPSWRFELAGARVAVGLPLDWGLSGEDYYLNNNGSNAFFGYFSTALTTSVVLPVSDRFGQWFLNTSLQYLHLGADSVLAINGGDQDEFIGKLGVSFVY